MTGATMRRIEALLHERQQLWTAGGDNRDAAERIAHELDELYDARRRRQVGRGFTNARPTTTAWARWSR